MNNLDKDTPVWQLTLGELIYSIKQSFPQNIHFPIENDDEDNYITGLKELSKYLGISNDNNNDSFNLIGFMAFWIISFLLSTLIYKYFEVPTTKLRDKK